MADGAAPPADLAEALARHGQEHLLRGWAALDGEGRARLEADLRCIDLPLVEELARRFTAGDGGSDEPLGEVRPIDVVRLPRSGQDERWRDAAARGEAALAAGELAVVVVAGGQGTRLGFDGPKGVYPIGPVADTTLFEIHAHKVRALERRHGVTVPLYVMTSPTNHAATAAFFAEHDGFGLAAVRLFVQGTMPAVDRRDGRILLAARDRVALSPDGHGGTVRALAARGPDGPPSPLEDMRARGVRTLFYFQVDNPLVRIADPAFIGFHRAAGAEMSSKVVEKRRPDEKVGLIALVDGVPRTIEYSDLPDDLAGRRRDDGGLELWAGSIAIHLFERDFVERLAGGDVRLPFHRAVKKVAHVDEDGREVEPEEPNAIKFETFIFDAMPLARAQAVVETDRELEFEPLKNASGESSPESVRARMTEVFAGWLEEAGTRVVRDADGRVPFPIEIDPLVATGPDGLRGRIAPGTVVDGPLRIA